jgi:peptidoglycan/xylan/chitin deacetylase (PgdA/CDA1 family)
MSTSQTGGAMNRVKFVLESRGLANAVDRTWQIVSRFGLTASRMERRLAAYAEAVAEYGSRPSLPMTASVLARNPQVAANLVARGVEICVHGYVHNDLSRLSEAEQARQIGEACEIFRRHRVPFAGFRSPYLKYNQATLAVVERLGFAYDSNLPFYWEPPAAARLTRPAEREGLERGLAFYSPQAFPRERSLPRFVGPLVEIPVSLPDDEILLDRMGLEPERVGEIWLEVLAMALARGELFTLQLHPERFSILKAAVGGVLAEAARSGRVWLASLGEIASWWRDRAAAEVRIDPAGGDAYRVSAFGPSALGLTLVVPASGRGAPVASPGTVKAPCRPVIGVAPDLSDNFRLRIKEAGYYIETTLDGTAHPLYFKTPSDPDQALSSITRLGHPVLKAGTWPRPFEAALAVTGDIDCLTLGDFLRRFTEG